MSGSVDPGGGKTRYILEYGLSTEYGTKIERVIPAANEAVPVHLELKNSSLVPNQEYDFRLVALNNVGRAESPNLRFTAPEREAPPTAFANPPSETSRSAFTLKGDVYAGGLPTSYRFELGKTLAYGTNLPAGEGTLAGGERVVGVEALASGLQPDTTYHYRVVAKNALGEAKSIDQVFTTLPEAPSATATPTPRRLRATC